MTLGMPARGLAAVVDVAAAADAPDDDAADAFPAFAAAARADWTGASAEVTGAS